MASEPRLSRAIFKKALDASRVQRLFDQAGGPLISLRIRHLSWIIPVGQLKRFSILAAQKLVRRGLDSLFEPNMVAVGRFKVFVRPSEYAIELHLVVAGTSGIKLQRAFDDAMAAEAGNVRRAIDNMLTGRQEVRISFHAWKALNAYGEALDPSYEQWPEYIGCLRKHSRSLVFRYGCDRYLNKLKKQRHLKHVKARKGHPDPYWLEPFQFGGPWWDQNVVERRLPRLSRSRRRRFDLDEDPDYFSLEDN